MSFCIVCFLRARGLALPGQANSGQQARFSGSSDLNSELEDSRKFSLSSLMALLAIFSVFGAGSALQSVVLILLIYTISLRLAITTCFLHNYPTLTRLFHVVPILCTSCMAGVALIFSLQSPALAAVGLLLGVLPLVTLVIHHGRQCYAETSSQGLPMQMQDVSAPSGSNVSRTTEVNGS